MLSDQENIFGGWYPCERCSRPVKNGEKCSLCYPKPIEGIEECLLSDEEMMAEIWDLGFGLEGMEGRTPTQKERFERIAQAQLHSPKLSQFREQEKRKAREEGFDVGYFKGFTDGNQVGQAGMMPIDESFKEGEK